MMQISRNIIGLLSFGILLILVLSVYWLEVNNILLYSNLANKEQVSRTSDQSVSVESLSENTRSSKCDTCQWYDLTTDGTVFDYPCRDMHVEPVVPICLYPIDKDIYLSYTFWMNKTWEPEQMSSTKKWLNTDPELGMIDIGANIGAFTLQIASIGRTVVAVEPNIENARRIHKAVTLGKLANRISLLNNAVSSERGISKFVFSSNNQGATRVEKVEVKANRDYNTDEYIKSIVMDDLLPYCKFKKAIMKIDIEGFEHQAFAQAGDLFDNIDIPYVQMEWFHVRERGKTPSEVEDSKLFTKMMSFFVDRHYIPLDVATEKTLNIVDWYDWPMDIIWMKT